MWTHALLTLYRSLTRHRLYAALNILGLAVGIAVFLVLWLDVRFETSFERWIPNARNVYRLYATCAFVGVALRNPSAPTATPWAGTLGGAARGLSPAGAGTRMLATDAGHGPPRIGG